MPPAALLLGLLLCAPPPAPQEGNELYTTLDTGGGTLRYLDTDLSPTEATIVLENFLMVRNAYRTLLTIDPGNPEITVRIRSGQPRYYYLSGPDRITVDYPSRGDMHPVVIGDQRILKMARLLFAQMWLYRHLSSTAGLDPDLLPSILQYLDWLADQHGPPPEGPASVWYNVDQVYGTGFSTFVLNAITGQKLRAHEVVPFFRKVIVDLSYDADSPLLLDAFGPPLPLFLSEDLPAGEPLEQDAPLRPSRLALFNGVRLLDLDVPELSAADRFNDFNRAFSMVMHFYPDGGLRGDPPRLAGVDVWQLFAEFRPRVEYARDNLDFYLVMRELLGRFRDRFTAILSPHGRPLWRGPQGLTVDGAGGRLYVARVSEGSAAAAAGIRAGMEVAEVDGRPAAQVLATLAEYFRTLESCVSEPEVRVRAINMLLTGPDGVPVRLKLLAPGDGAPPLEVELQRGAPGAGGGAAGSAAPVVASVRPDGIGVLQVKAFVASAAPLFARELAGLAKQGVKGIVIDLRGNEVGEPKPALDALGLVVDRSVSLGSLVIRKVDQPMGSVELRPITARPMPNVPTWQGKAAVLIDAWTSGPAELFALGFRLAGRGELIGQATPGSFSEPIQYQDRQTLTASGLQVSLTQNTLVGRDNQPLLGRGLEPSVACESGPGDFAGRVDAPLEAAARLLLQ